MVNLKLALVITLSLYVFDHHTTHASEDPVYLFFDASDSLTCTFQNEHFLERMRMYNKFSDDSTITFYICKEMFVFNQSSDQADTLDVAYLEKIRFSRVDDLIAKVNLEANKSLVPFVAVLYPDSYFEEIYIVEKINEGKLILRNVFWQYYIE